VKGNNQCKFPGSGPLLLLLLFLLTIRAFWCGCVVFAWKVEGGGHLSLGSWRFDYGPLFHTIISWQLDEDASSSSSSSSSFFEKRIFLIPGRVVYYLFKWIILIWILLSSKTNDTVHYNCTRGLSIILSFVFASRGDGIFNMI
jgi:hypothetical protein